jgi:hypothetical protein
MRTFFLMSAVVALAGCGSSTTRPEVQGTLTYRGKPVADKTLNLVFDAPGAESFSTILPVGADGSFAGQVPKPGAYKVVVTDSLAAMERFDKEKRDGGRDAVPTKYRAADTSDVTVTINPGRNENLTIELKD